MFMMSHDLLGRHFSLTDASPDHIWRVADTSSGWLLVVLVDPAPPYQAFTDLTTERKVRAKKLDLEYTDRGGNGWQVVNPKPETVASLPEESMTQAIAEAIESAPGEVEQTPDKEPVPASEGVPLTMSAYVAKFRGRYQKVKAPGRKTASLTCDDWLAQILLPLTPGQVASLASALLTLRTDLYAHLNPGQQRMNWGNRLRHAAKTGKVSKELIMKMIPSVTLQSPGEVQDQEAAH
jgi:hypothetical protein